MWSDEGAETAWDVRCQRLLRHALRCPPSVAVLRVMWRIVTTLAQECYREDGAVDWPQLTGRVEGILNALAREQSPPGTAWDRQPTNRASS